MAKPRPKDTKGARAPLFMTRSQVLRLQQGHDNQLREVTTALREALSVLDQVRLMRLKEAEELGLFLARYQSPAAEPIPNAPEPSPPAVEATGAGL